MTFRWLRTGILTFKDELFRPIAERTIAHKWLAVNNLLEFSVQPADSQNACLRNLLLNAELRFSSLPMS